MKVVKITRESGIPLIGLIQVGVIDRGSNLLQVRPTSACNLRCKFCSTSSGEASMHPTEYYVDIDYLISYVKEVAEFKGSNGIVFIDSVGEPLMHPDIIKLVKELRKIKAIKRIVMITNGVLLTKELVNSFEKLGLDQINLSLDSIDPKLASDLAGCKYNVGKIIDIAKYINKSKIDLMITPVWIPGINDSEIISIIKFVKELGCKIGLQNYETHKRGRRVKGAKRLNYYKFYKKLGEWEKEFGVKLKLGPKDFGIEKAERIPNIFKKGEKIQVKIVCDGWYEGELVGVSKNRCVTVIDRKANKGDLINVKVVDDKNNIYLAK